MTAPLSRIDSGQHGFTLVEMVVALTVLGLLTVAMFGGVRFGTAVWQKASHLVDASEQMRGAHDFLRRVLASAYPLLNSPEGPNEPRVLAFEGKRSRVRTLTADLATEGLTEVTLATEVGSDGLALVAEAKRMPAQNGGRRETILAGLQDVEFAYLSPESNGHPATWESQWLGRSRLPELVRVRVQFPAGDSRLWFDLFVAPRIHGDASCRVDLLTGDCLGR